MVSVNHTLERKIKPFSLRPPSENGLSERRKTIFGKSLVQDDLNNPWKIIECLRQFVVFGKRPLKPTCATWRRHKHSRFMSIWSRKWSWMREDDHVPSSRKRVWSAWLGSTTPTHPGSSKRTLPHHPNVHKDRTIFKSDVCMNSTILSYCWLHVLFLSYFFSLISPHSSIIMRR